MFNENRVEVPQAERELTLARVDGGVTASSGSSVSAQHT